MSPWATGWERAQTCLRQWLAEPPFKHRDGKWGIRSSGGGFAPKLLTPDPMTLKALAKGGVWPACHGSVTGLSPCSPVTDCPWQLPCCPSRAGPWGKKFADHCWATGVHLRKASGERCRHRGSKCPGLCLKDLSPAKQSEKVINETRVGG